MLPRRPPNGGSADRIAWIQRTKFSRRFKASPPVALPTVPAPESPSVPVTGAGKLKRSLREAIAEQVHDGDALALGLALESGIPFAAVHEIIRQQRRDLTLIGPISDMAFDQMIAAGTVPKVLAAWVGDVA